MALQAHRNPQMNFKLIGIVCVNGNTGVNNVCVNVTRILEEMDATEVNYKILYLFLGLLK